jgi:carbon storage regulator
MLVLSRKAGESIVINDNITVTVVSVAEGRIRLGIAAPKEVIVHRQEVAEAIARQGAPRAGEATVAQEEQALRSREIILLTEEGSALLFVR